MIDDNRALVRHYYEEVLNGRHRLHQNLVEAG